MACPVSSAHVQKGSPRCEHCPNLTYFELFYIESSLSVHLSAYSKPKQYFDILSYFRNFAFQNADKPAVCLPHEKDMLKE